MLSGISSLMDELCNLISAGERSPLGYPSLERMNVNAFNDCILLSKFTLFRLVGIDVLLMSSNVTKHMIGKGGTSENDRT